MRVSHVLCVAVGAAAAALLAPLFDDAAVVRPRVPVHSSRDVEALHRRMGALSARVQQLENTGSGAMEHVLDNLTTRVDEMESKIAEYRREELVEDLEYPEPDDARRIRAVYLATVPARLEESVEAWTKVAEGTADPERKADAYFEIGQLQIKLRNAEAAAVAYGRVVDLIGLGGARGQVAAQRLGLCQYWSKDKVAAYRTFRRLADAPSLMHCTEPTIRYWAATLAARTGDLEYARRELSRFVADYDRRGYEAFEEDVRHATELLKELE